MFWKAPEKKNNPALREMQIREQIEKARAEGMPDLTERAVVDVFNQCFPVGRNSEGDEVRMRDRAALERYKDKIAYLLGQLGWVHMGNERMPVKMAAQIRYDGFWTQNGELNDLLIGLGVESGALAPFQQDSAGQPYLDISHIKPAYLTSGDPFSFEKYQTGLAEVKKLSEYTTRSVSLIQELEQEQEGLSWEDGLKAQEEKNFPLALKIFKHYADADPQDSSAHFKTGIMYVQLGQIEEAMEYLQRAADLGSNAAKMVLQEIQKNSRQEPQVPFDDGMEAYQNGQYEQAAKIFKLYTDASDEDEAAFLMLGLCYLQLGVKDLGVRHIQHAADLGYGQAAEILKKLRESGFC